MKNFALLVGALLLSTNVLAATVTSSINNNALGKLWNTHNDVNAIGKHGFPVVWGGKDILQSSAINKQTLLG